MRPEACCGVQGLLGCAGISSSASESGQQWDRPNAWPPLQDIMIESLHTYCGERRRMATALHRRHVPACKELTSQFKASTGSPVVDPTTGQGFYEPLNLVQDILPKGSTSNPPLWYGM